MNLVLLGRQGSGKGTQAENLSKHYHWRVFGTGDRLRELAQHDPALDRILRSGQLAPDSAIVEIVTTDISQRGADGIIYEGIPRNLGQLKDLTKILAHHNQPLPVGVLIDITLQEAHKRLAARRVCSNCGAISFPGAAGYTENICHVCGGKLIRRSDDTEEAITQRLAIFERTTQPIIEYFREHNQLITVDGAPAIPVVTQELIQAIDAYRLRKNSTT